MIKIEQKQTSKTEEHVKEHCIYTKLTVLLNIFYLHSTSSSLTRNKIDK